MKYTHWSLEIENKFKNIWTACKKLVHLSHMDFHNPTCPNCKIAKNQHEAWQTKRFNGF